MEQREKRVLMLDQYEHGVIINALNEMRNDLLEEQRPTDIVDEVLLKTIDAPRRRKFSLLVSPADGSKDGAESISGTSDKKRGNRNEPR